MIKRLLAVAFIFFGTSVAWAVLGGTILSRTNDSDSRLRGRVQSVWGVPQTQRAPQAVYLVPVTTQETIEENGKKRIVEKTMTGRRPYPPASSNATATLALEHRRKGLLWYSTYKVDFQGDYEFHNPFGTRHTTHLTLPFPAASALYDGLTFVIDGKPTVPNIDGEKAWVEMELAAGQTTKLQVAYRSQGLDSWACSFGDKVNPVEKFRLRVNTNFKDIDFADNTLAPGAKRETGNGWQLDWNYSNLLSGYQIALTIPAKLQPGPLASGISFFAPVSLFFFFFVIFILTTTRGIDMHPMNYFFLAAAFFAFHLLLAYLVDHLDISAAFAISALVSVALVASYLRLVIGPGFAFREAAIA